MKTSQKLISSIAAILISGTLLSACALPWQDEEEVDETPVTQGCTFIKEQISTESKAAKLLVAYFNAIDGMSYETAYNLLSDDMKAHYSESSNTDPLIHLAEAYRGVSCIRIVGMENVSDQVANSELISASLGIQWYQLEIEATYESPLDTADGKLAIYYKTQSDPHADEGDNGIILEIAESI